MNAAAFATARRTSGSGTKFSGVPQKWQGGRLLTASVAEGVDVGIGGRGHRRSGRGRRVGVARNRRRATSTRCVAERPPRKVKTKSAQRSETAAAPCAVAVAVASVSARVHCSGAKGGGGGGFVLWQSFSCARPPTRSRGAPATPTARAELPADGSPRRWRACTASHSHYYCMLLNTQQQPLCATGGTSTPTAAISGDPVPSS